jgi:hypothetical protein
MFLNVNLMEPSRHFSVMFILVCAGVLMRVEKNVLERELKEHRIAVSIF